LGILCADLRMFLPMTRPRVAFSDKVLADFRRALLLWYAHDRRDLPWRKTRDPYRIWVSEIMLQQTRVAAVIEHYRLFVKRFSSLRSLAAASESAVLAVWSGLGYYRRARMMRQCAQEIVDKHRARFPRTSDALRALPGIGPYTAAAIASIAFDEPIAVVDGNVERVLQRMTGDKVGSREVWALAQRLISRIRPGDFNQAMMELGAMVCVPRQPKCEGCPVRKWCVTRGNVPRENPKVSQKRKEIWCALAQRDGHIRLRQRSQRSALMAGMWELPQSPKLWRSTPDPASRRTFRHSVTTTNYTVHVIVGLVRASRGRWIAVERVPDLPLTGLTRKILRAHGII
jgi:A/G-specific adenine glycosylase